MGKKKVLFVSQEIYPYLPETEMSLIGRHLPQQIQEDDKDVRIFMPRLTHFIIACFEVLLSGSCEK